MTPMAEDMNTIAITGLIMWPVVDARPVRFVELKIVNSPAMTYIAAHVPAALRRVLYTLEPGDHLLVRGHISACPPTSCAGLARRNS
jgi:hypothetical protein